MKIKVKSTDELIKLIFMKGFNKTEFANEIGMSQSIINAIANGDRNPSPKTAKRICEVLECSWVDVFIFESEESK